MPPEGWHSVAAHAVLELQNVLVAGPSQYISSFSYKVEYAGARKSLNWQEIQDLHRGQDVQR